MTQVNWTGIFGKAARFAGTSYGQGIVGQLSQPVFGDLEEYLIQQNEKADKGETQNAFVRGLNWLRHTFSWGDLISLGGLAAWIGEEKYLKTEEGDLSFFKKILKYATIGITVGGSLTSLIGRVFGLHKIVALGDAYAEYLLAEAEAKGKKIFTEFDEGQKNKFKENAVKLNRTLVYKKSIESDVLNRHKDEKIGGFFDGPFGTGKTVGVECILGNWIEKAEKEGCDTVVAKLNLANFNDYIKEKKDKAQSIAQGVKAIDNRLGQFGSLAENHGIMVLELLIKKIQKLKARVAAHNQRVEGGESQEKKQRLAIFVDEFDKVFDPATLKGCDKGRLGTLLAEFNQLYVDENLLLTSNLKLEQIIKRLKDNLYVDEENTGEQVWGAVESRMSTNRVPIGLPEQTEQAQIIAGYLLEDFKGKIDLTSFGIDEKKLTGDITKDRVVLGAAIFCNIFAKDASINLSPRHIGEGVMKKIKRNLDDNQTINLTLVHDAITGQMENRKDISDSELRNQTGYNIIDEYLRLDGTFEKIKQKADELRKAKKEIDIFKLLEAVYEKRETRDGAAYESKKTVPLNSKHYCHSIVVYEGHDKDGAKTEPQVRIDFAECNKDTRSGQIDRLDFYPTDTALAREFKAKIAPKIMHATRDKDGELIKLFIDGVVNLALGGNPDNLVADFAEKYKELS